MTDNPGAFKHHLDGAAVDRLADKLGAVHAAFDRRGFVRVAARLAPLELKARVEVIAEASWQAIGLDFERAAAVIVRAAEVPVEGQGAFTLWPLVRVIGRYGLDHRDVALAALRALTRHFSGEFDVRGFIVTAQDETLAELGCWLDDPSEHVRRLVSEGSRPRLPWGLRLQALVADPRPILPLLEHLKHDPSEYVRRSVANSLNDIAKDHPELVIATVTRWREDGVERALLSHALRSLVKAGRADALAALGHGDARGLVVHDLQVPRAVAIGDDLTLAFTLENRGAARSIVVDYAIHYLGQRGLKKAPKVFKLKTTTLAARASLVVAKRHAMKHVSIRRLVAGRHQVDIQVNGVVLASAAFELT